MTKQFERHIAESLHFQEVLKWKSTIKKLTPLLALGNEASSRMHDIRDKITALRATFDKLASTRRPPSAADVQEGARRGRQLSDEMATILSQQLNTFRNAREARRPIKIKQLVAEMKERFRLMFHVRGIELEIVGNDLESTVRVQKFYYMRVLLNLLSNASYFCVQGVRIPPIVRVELKVINNRFLSIVEDTGPGVQVVESDDLFEPGYSTRPHSTGGLGSAEDAFGIRFNLLCRIIREPAWRPNRCWQIEFWGGENHRQSACELDNGICYATLMFTLLPPAKFPMGRSTNGRSV